MYSEPCARLTKFMMPKISVSPADSRNSRTPSCTPLRICVARSCRSISQYACRLLHWAILVVGVLLRLERSGDFLEVEPALIVLDDFKYGQVLDGEVVVAELEVAAHRREVGLLQGRHEGGLVFDVALDLLYGRIEQLRSVIALRGKIRGDAFVFLLELGHEFLVGGIVKVGPPDGAGDDAQGAVALGGKIDGVGRRGGQD